jgi:hypothetical protein
MTDDANDKRSTRNDGAGAMDTLLRFFRGLVEQGKPTTGTEASGRQEDGNTQAKPSPDQASDTRLVRDSFAAAVARLQNELEAFGPNAKIVMKIKRIVTVIPDETFMRLENLRDMSVAAKAGLASAWLKDMLDSDDRIDLSGFSRWHLSTSTEDFRTTRARISVDDDGYRPDEEEIELLRERARKTHQIQTRIIYTIDYIYADHATNATASSTGQAVPFHLRYRVGSAAGAAIGHGIIDSFPVVIGREAGPVVELERFPKVSRRLLILSMDAGRPMVSKLEGCNVWLIDDLHHDVHLPLNTPVPLPVKSRLLLASREPDREAAWIELEYSTEPTRERPKRAYIETKLASTAGAGTPSGTANPPSPPPSETATSDRGPSAAETQYQAKHASPVVIALRYANGEIDRIPVTTWPCIVGREPDANKPERGACVRAASLNVSRAHLSIEAFDGRAVTIRNLKVDDRIALLDNKPIPASMTVDVVSRDAATGWILLGNYEVSETSAEVRVEWANQ